MAQDNFLKKLEGTNRQVTVASDKTSLPPVISPEVISKNLQSLIFDDCRFEELHFEDLRDLSILFHGCKISTLTIRSSKIAETKIDGKGIPALEMNNCEIGEMRFEDVTCVGDILIASHRYIREIDIKLLHFDNVQIGRSLSLKELGIETTCLSRVESQTVNINSCKFRKSVILSGFHCKIFQTKECTFDNELDIVFLATKSIQNLEFFKNRCDGLVTIKDVWASEQIDLIDNALGSGGKIELVQQNLTKPMVSLSNNHHADLLSLTSSNDNLPYLKELILENNSHGIAHVQIESIKVGALTIGNQMYNSILTLKNISLRHVGFRNINNRGTVVFDGVKFLNGSTMVIEKSRLGDTRFSKVEFRDLEDFTCEASDLSLTSYRKIKWFYGFKLENQHTETDDQINLLFKGWMWLSCFVKGRKTLHQSISYIWKVRKHVISLHESLVKTGSRNKAAQFKALELKSHAIEHTWTKPIYSPDRIIFALARTNSFRQNWLKAVILGGLVLILTYPAFVCSFDSRVTFSPATSWDEASASMDIIYGQYGKFIWQLANPAHNTPKIFGGYFDHFTGITHALDFFYRVVVSFFVFQVITSFRRFF